MWPVAGLMAHETTYGMEVKMITEGMLSASGMVAMVSSNDDAPDPSSGGSTDEE